MLSRKSKFLTAVLICCVWLSGFCPAYASSPAKGYDQADIDRILQEDITIASSLTDAQKKSCLLGEMRYYYQEFDQKSVGIKYEALTAIAAMETGHFTSDICRVYNNVGGMKNSNGFLVYATKEEGIAALADLLRNEYLSENGNYYEGKTILDVSKHYNPSKHWLLTYAKIRLDMERRANEHRDLQSAREDRAATKSSEQDRSNVQTVHIEQNRSCRRFVRITKNLYILPFVGASDQAIRKMLAPCTVW